MKKCNRKSDLVSKIRTIENENIEYVLLQLRALGISLTINDFGSGYSQLLQLEKANVSRLAVEEAILEKIDQNPRSLLFLESIIDMGRKLDMGIRIKNVRNPSQLDIIRVAGCHEFQGNYFCSAKPYDAIERLFFGNNLEKFCAVA